MTGGYRAGEGWWACEACDIEYPPEEARVEVEGHSLCSWACLCDFTYTMTQVWTHEELVSARMDRADKEGMT